MREPSEVVELLFWDLQGERWFGNLRSFVCFFFFFLLDHCLYRARQRDYTASPSQELKHPQLPLSHK